jgi:predicted HD phosphohydrolase
MEKVSYQHMADMTAEDTQLIIQDGVEEAAELADRLLDSVRLLKNFQGPLLVTRYEHSLQSATRAYQDGQSEEYIVAALLHDIGDHIAPYSHGEYVAAVLKPYVNERVCWIINKHPLFQAYYYAHHLGGDRNARERYRDHEWYDDCVDFCERFDQNCFETDFESLPLEFFEPMLRRVFSEPRYAADGMSILTDAAAAAS